jgi:penicillin-binding protein 2
MDTSSPRVRMSVLGVVVLGCFVALTARLWYLQVMEAPELTRVVTANITREVAVEAPRGRILDVNGKVLVDNRTSLVVTVDRRTLAELTDDGARDELVERLAAALTNIGGRPTKIDTVERRLADVRYDPIQPVPVAFDVSKELQIYLAEHSADFPGVEVQRETVRIYPYGAAAANILGYVSRINAESLENAVAGVDPDTGVEKTYQANSNIGVAGIEATYEDDLRGTPGIERIEVDANNRPIRTVFRQDPRPGSDVQLNVDINLQIRAEQVLAQRLDEIRGTKQTDGDRRGAPAGSVVVLDPHGGGVRALATFPSYDPSEFVGGITNERYAQLTDVNGVNALIDRAISGQYAPGSTFKLVTADAALKYGYITPQTSYNDQRTYQVGNPPQTFNSTAANGWVNLPRALTVSSDVYFYWLGDRMDEGTTIQDTAAEFGFDALTGIDLPGEQQGFVWTKADKEALHEKYPNAYPEPTPWYTGDNVQLAIGQAVITVTPLQLANAYAALGNGGTLYQPHVAWRVLRPGTVPDEPVTAVSVDPASVLRTIEPVVIRMIDLPPERRNPIVDGLANVTRSGTAAATFAGLDQRAFPIVGKTGTAEVNGKADTSLFASYAPLADPQWAVTAVLEESGFGAEASGVVVCRVYEMLASQDGRCGSAPVSTQVRD